MKTVTEAFLETKNKPASQVALRYKEKGDWQDITWQEYNRTCERLAAGLASLGIKRGDRIAILSNTRYQWAVSDLAILGMGCITVPIYQSSTQEDADFILKDSEAVAIFVEDEQMVEKALKAKNKSPFLKYIVCFGEKEKTGILKWSDLLDKGRSYLKESPQFF